MRKAGVEEHVSPLIDLCQYSRMARSGAREAALVALLGEGGLRAKKSTAARPSLSTLPSELLKAIMTLYRELGGVLEAPRLAPAGWDLELEDGTLVELDEQQHFTRYRAATLAPEWASLLPWSDAYQSYCSAHERLAAGFGRFWTSPPSERQFGAAGTRGDFDRQGSPRAKQRALFNAIRDAHAVAGNVRLARISIYDPIGDSTLGAVLDGRADYSAASARSAEPTKARTFSRRHGPNRPVATKRFEARQGWR